MGVGRGQLRRIEPGSVLVMLILAGVCGCASAPEAAPAGDAFARLKGLVGTWVTTGKSGRTSELSFKLAANDSVVVETWSPGTARETMTLYSMDGDRLIATHYCAQGNQPRLVLVPSGDPLTLAFEFADGTNLDVPGGAHEHSFRIRIDGPDTFTSVETYVKNGATPAEIAATDPGAPIVYRRKAVAVQVTKP